jgi:hypothetical protein
MRAEVSNEQMSDAMLKAADYIKEHGHAKLTLKDSEGRVCLLGALLTVTTGSAYGGSSAEDRVADAAMDLLGMRLKEGNKPASAIDAIDWNNAEERTAEEVINLLKETGESLKAKEPA